MYFVLLLLVACATASAHFSPLESGGEARWRSDFASAFPHNDARILVDGNGAHINTVNPTSRVALLDKPRRLTGSNSIDTKKLLVRFMRIPLILRN
jgi:hypothetical protein